MCSIVLKDYGADRFYKFRNNPPLLFPLLTTIFTGSYATGQYAYASTQDPPDTNDERGLDDPVIYLNSSCAIIDLDELEMPCPGRRMP
jgi:hypothetical protein